VAAPAGFNDQLVLAVERRHAALATTFDRLLLQMTPREREALRGDWLAVEYRNGIDWNGAALGRAAAAGAADRAAGAWHRLLAPAPRGGRAAPAGAAPGRSDRQPACRGLPGRREADGTLSFPFIAGDLQALFGITRQQAEQDARMLLERIEEDDRARILQAVEQAARQFAH
jgi:two-component system sensor histidine kinase EvgS